MNIKLFIKKNLIVILKLIDIIYPKKKTYWIFPVYFIGEGNFSDNMLAVFEEVKNNERIKKIILTRNKKIDVEGKNTVILPMNSYKAIWFLLQAKVIFVQHSLWLDLKEIKFKFYHPAKRIIVNLWHGIPIKDISHPNTGIIKKNVYKEMKEYRIITSSEIDKKNMIKAFKYTPKDNFWITGLPRNDFLLKDERDMPKNLRKEIKKLNDLLKGRKLILYAPTYREINVDGSYYYEFNSDQINVMRKWLKENNYVLGIRYHIYLQPTNFNYLFQSDSFLNLSANIISDVRILIKYSEAVITDYSSLFVDALYIDKPCISFAYDYEHYLNQQRGFFYEFSEIFPGKICKTFECLMHSLRSINESNNNSRQQRIKKILFHYLDDKNSFRVVEKLKKELDL